MAQCHVKHCLVPMTLSAWSAAPFYPSRGLALATDPLSSTLPSGSTRQRRDVGRYARRRGEIAHGESSLGADFLNATRLLLDSLKNPELFNASLDATVDALANPYMLVEGDNEFLLAEQASSEKTRSCPITTKTHFKGLS
ncbi:hypothetical protein EV363DRAFT_1397073 [Boletus edulis]|nr:hypothetical protein EV363DRAFT_1397073 [Boletus edulis]